MAAFQSQAVPLQIPAPATTVTAPRRSPQHHLHNRVGLQHGSRGRGTRIHVGVEEAVSAAADPPTAEITWQIVVGAIAGITPFIVAGIEFGKRIAAQRRCKVCGGSGLVRKQKEDYYARCPACGGFLPWQSWKRFFTG